MEYERLIQKLGSLHGLLRELETAGLYQGEHTIVYAGADGTQHTLHVYIDGTELQMFNTLDNPGLDLSGNFSVDA